MTEVTIRAANIFVSDLRLQAQVGVNPDEQGVEQSIAVDVRVGSDDLARSVASERLGDTTDYVEIADAVRGVVKRRHFPLVESLAHAMALAVLELRGATWARVRVRKLKCLEGSAGAGVEVEVSAPAARPTPVTRHGLSRREDVIIVGGGVAGLSAAQWCWRLGHPAVLLEPSPWLGGQLHQVHGMMPDLPALPPMNGKELARRLEQQFAGHGGRWLRGKMVGLEELAEGWSVEVEEEGDGDRDGARDGARGGQGQGQGQGQGIVARGLILALGIRRRALGVPGERALAGQGILDTAARDPAAQAGRAVAVIGGGDAACENAIILARAGARVILLHRGLRPTCREEFIPMLKAEARITLRPHCGVTGFSGRQRLEAVTLVGPQGEETLKVQAALVRVGWEPNSDAVPRAWLDDQGFVRVDTHMQVLGAERACAAGDITGPASSSVASAVGAGANAARAMVARLERMS